MTDTVIEKKPFGVTITDGIDIRQLIRDPEVEDVPTVLQQFEISLNKAVANAVTRLSNHESYDVEYIRNEKDNTTKCVVTTKHLSGQFENITINEEGTIIQIRNHLGCLDYDPDQQIYRASTSVPSPTYFSDLSVVVNSDDFVLLESIGKSSGGDAKGPEISLQYSYDPSAQAFVVNDIYHTDDKHDILNPTECAFPPLPFSHTEKQLLIKEPFTRLLDNLTRTMADPFYYYETYRGEADYEWIWNPAGNLDQFVTLNAYKNGVLNFVRSESLGSIFWTNFRYEGKVNENKRLIIVSPVNTMEGKRILKPSIYELEIVKNGEMYYVIINSETRFELGEFTDLNTKDSFFGNLTINKRIGEIILRLSEESAEKNE